MAALVCDLCGGKLVMGSGGIATCDSCGMEHSADRMQEKVQEIKGIVRVDNSHMIDNYLEMAQTALDAGNNTEAETYCNKIIEINPANYKALMIKGEAVAWQSTLQNSRVDEGIAAFAKAIKNAPEDEKDELIKSAIEQIKRLSVAMISLRGERFTKWPDEEEANGFITDITSILGTIVSFMTQTGKGLPIGIEEILSPIAEIINQSVVQAWQNVIWPEYNGDPNDSDDRANKYEWQRFIERVGYCTNLLERAVTLCDEDVADDIQKYENLIFIHKAAIDSCSWDYSFTDWGTKRWYKDWRLSDEAKIFRRQKISEYELKIKEINLVIQIKEATEKAEKERIAREEAQKRIDNYWAEHADEKDALEAERDGLNSQIESLTKTLDAQIESINKEIEAIPGGVEIANLDERINKLISDKNALGFFKGKEKKAIQEQIDHLATEKSAIQTRMAAAKKELEAKITVAKADTEKNIAPMLSRVTAIYNELTKER